MLYINPQQLITNLSLGKPIEQWLGYSRLPDYTVLKRLTIDKENNKFSVVYFEIFDEGNEDFTNIYEFNIIDTDEPYGIMDIFKTPKEAIDHALEKYNCKIDKFINSGLMQKEYEEYLKSRRQK